jgi:hypothetical protein
LTSIFGAELKNGNGLRVNYLKRRDLYKKRLIFFNLKRQKWFATTKNMPMGVIFSIQTNEQVFVGAAFGQNRPFHKKLSLGTAFPSH